MRKITREYAEKLIRSTNGSIFSVEFVKANGELRVMTCRTGVSKGITGKGQSFVPSEHDLITVFDLQRDAYRMVNLNTLRRITTDGSTFAVIQ